jgi:hypothetical protein
MLAPYIVYTGSSLDFVWQVKKKKIWLDFAGKFCDARDVISDFLLIIFWALEEKKNTKKNYDL